VENILRKFRRESVVASFEVLARNLPERTYKNDVELQTGYPIFTQIVV
jgi:hypothetical protein